MDAREAATAPHGPPAGPMGPMGPMGHGFIYDQALLVPLPPGGPNEMDYLTYTDCRSQVDPMKSPMGRMQIRDLTNSL